MNEMIGLAIIILGILFNISGCIGLVRLPDVYNRIQASSKCVTIGTSLIVVGSVIWLGSTSAVIKGVICVAFILVTSSTAAHALARAAHRSGVKLCEQSVIDAYAEDRAADSKKEESAS